MTTLRARRNRRRWRNLTPWLVRYSVACVALLAAFAAALCSGADIYP